MKILTSLVWMAMVFCLIGFLCKTPVTKTNTATSVGTRLWVISTVLEHSKENETKVKTKTTKATETTTESETTTKATTTTTTTTTTKPTTTRAETTTTTTTTTTAVVSSTNENKSGNNYLGRFKITGYTAEEGFPEGSATASGVGCRPGICAMNNAQRKELGIKYGDTIYIEGLGSYQVRDCGCGYNVIDIWLYTNAEAYSITGHYDVYI